MNGRQLPLSKSRPMSSGKFSPLHRFSHQLKEANGIYTALLLPRIRNCFSKIPESQHRSYRMLLLDFVVS